jgi:hypothetical protein
MLRSRQYVGLTATRKKAAIPAPDAFAKEASSVWGQGEFFLDASELPPLPSGQHPILNIAASARSKGLRLIPVTRLDALAPYQKAVAQIVAADKRGLALRANLTTVTSAATWAGEWPFPLAETDLIVDLSGSASTVLTLGQAAINAFAGLHKGTDWRSVTVAGTSMPDNFTGLAKGTYEIPRAEWSLWQNLSAAKLPYRIDYGDYTTPPIKPPPEGIAWGFPINVRYTLDGAFLICRGVTTTRANAEDMAPQLVKHAKTIQKYPMRNGVPNCWGDGMIDQIAAKAVLPGALENWVRIGVNRHVEITRANLP